MRPGLGNGIALAVLLTAAAAAGVAYLLLRSESLPSGPEPVVWSRTPCAECRMSVGDRAYAAQLQTKDGQVLHFDDPGCLFRYERRERPQIHATYYRHLHEDRWIPEASVGFLDSGRSPMGFDLGAVDAGSAGAMTAAAARASALRPRRFGGGGDSDVH